MYGSILKYRIDKFADKLYGYNLINLSLNFEARYDYITTYYQLEGYPKITFLYMNDIQISYPNESQKDFIKKIELDKKYTQEVEIKKAQLQQQKIEEEKLRKRKLQEYEEEEERVKKFRKLDKEKQRELIKFSERL